MAVDPKYDRIRESPPYCLVYEILVSYIYPRANLLLGLRPIAHFALELEHFIHDHTTHIKNGTLWSKGIAIHAYHKSQIFHCEIFHAINFRVKLNNPVTIRVNNGHNFL